PPRQGNHKLPHQRASHGGRPSAYLELERTQIGPPRMGFSMGNGQCSPKRVPTRSNHAFQCTRMLHREAVSLVLARSLGPGRRYNRTEMSATGGRLSDAACGKNV